MRRCALERLNDIAIAVAESHVDRRREAGGRIIPELLARQRSDRGNHIGRSAGEGHDEPIIGYNVGLLRRWLAELLRVLIWALAEISRPPQIA